MPIKSIICDECGVETEEFHEDYDSVVHCESCHFHKAAREAKAHYEERRTNIKSHLESLKRARGEMRRTARELKEFEDRKEAEKNSTVLGGGTDRDEYGPLTEEGVLARLRFWTTKNPGRSWSAKNLSVNCQRSEIQRIGKILAALLRKGRVALVTSSPCRTYTFPEAL